MATEESPQRLKSYPSTLPLNHPYGFASRLKNARLVWEAVKDIPGATADFHFNGEAAIHFPPEALPKVPVLAGARKKRRLSEDHKAKLAEVPLANRFKPKTDGSNSLQID